MIRDTRRMYSSSSNFYVQLSSDYSDLGIDMWQLLPFSRGSVKITVGVSGVLKLFLFLLTLLQSNDPFTKPSVNVNYFSVDYDLSVQIAGARLSRQILGSPPLSSLSTGETVPGKSAVPDNGDGGSDSAWMSWITDKNGGFAAVHHPVGTAAMMKRSLGGRRTCLSLCASFHLRMLSCRCGRRLPQGLRYSECSGGRRIHSSSAD
jgi:hypothetical protein